MIQMVSAVALLTYLCFFAIETCNQLNWFYVTSFSCCFNSFMLLCTA